MKKFFFYILLLVCTIQLASNADHAKKYGKKDSYGESTSLIKATSQDGTKRDIIKQYCTNAKSVTIVPSEDEIEIYEITNYHVGDEKPKKIDLIKLEKTLEELGTTLKGRKLSAVLKDLYCLTRKEVTSVLKSNLINSKKKIDDELIKSQPFLSLPEEVVLYVSDLEIEKDKKDEIGPVQDPKSEPAKEKFKKELRNKLFTAAKEKLNAFDNKILETEEAWNLADKQLITLRKDYKDIKNSVENTLDVTFNKNIPEIREKYLELKEKNRIELKDLEIKKIEDKLKKQKEVIDALEKLPVYTDVKFLKSKFDKAKKNKDLQRKNGKFYSVEFFDDQSINIGNIKENIDDATSAIAAFDNKIQDINVLREEIEDLDTGANKKSTSDLILEYIVYIVIFLFVVAVITFIYLQSRKIKKLSKMSRSTESKFTDMEDKLRSTSAKIRASRETRRGERPEQSSEPTEAPKTPQQIKLEKFNDLKRDYDEAKENFSKIAGFKQKWNGVALSRKERQEGSKTVLVSSGRAFEKSEIWCVGFDDKIFAFPGSSVYSNMATYMNLDFEKAHRDFKGVFNISAGSNYSVEPTGLRKGGAGYVVEMQGKIQFPR